MQTNSAFYLAARERFPALAQKADRKYLKYWNEQPLAAEPYSWFESAANALNDDMQREDSLVECSQFFEFVTQQASNLSSSAPCPPSSPTQRFRWHLASY